MATATRINADFALSAAKTATEVADAAEKVAAAAEQTVVEARQAAMQARVHSNWMEVLAASAQAAVAEEARNNRGRYPEDSQSEMEDQLAIRIRSRSPNRGR